MNDAFSELGDSIKSRFRRKSKMADENNYDENEYQDYQQMADEMGDDIPVPEPPRPPRAAAKKDTPHPIRPVIMQQPITANKQQNTAALRAKPETNHSPSDVQQVELNKVLSDFAVRLANLEMDMAAVIRLIKR